MLNRLRKLVHDESGATAIEYALIASLIAVAIVSAAGTLGGKIANTFNTVGSNLS